MDTVGRSLLDAVIAAPDDPAPRLVFADWAMEHGDRARGEYIVLATTLASSPWARLEQPDIVERAVELERRHGERWIREVLSPTIQGSLEGGFVENIAAKFGILRDELPSIARRTPLRTVTLLGGSSGGYEDLERLVASAGLLRVEDVRLPSLRINHKRVRAAFGRESALRRCAALDLRGGTITVSGAEAITALPATMLRAIDLTAVSMDGEIAERRAEDMVRSDAFERLERIDCVGEDTLGAAFVGAAALGRWPKLERLRVGNGRGLGALARVDVPLRDLFAGRVDGEVLAALAEAPFVPELRSLRLVVIDTPGAAHGVLRLLSRTRKLELLAIEGIALGDEGLAFVAASPNLAELRSIDISDWRVTARSAHLLATTPHLGRLREVVAAGLWIRIDDALRSALEDRFTRFTTHC